MSEIEALESEQGREFLVSGQKFMQYVEEQWEAHRVDKENEKQERVSKRSTFIYGHVFKKKAIKNVPSLPGGSGKYQSTQCPVTLF